MRLPPGDTSTERLVKIEGTFDQIEQAKELISEVTIDVSSIIIYSFYFHLLLVLHVCVKVLFLACKMMTSSLANNPAYEFISGRDVVFYFLKLLIYFIS